MFNVVVTSRLPVDVRDWLGPGARVEEPTSGTMPRERLFESLRDAEALIALLTVPVDEELLRAAPRLRIVANHAVGYDNVDVRAATRRGVVVTNTPDVLTETTADLTFALMLAVARRVVEGDVLVRSGAWTGWAPDQLLGTDVFGKTLGIVGFGRIGRAVARRARGFGMTVLYTSRRRAPADVEADLGATSTDLESLLAHSDFVSLHCPLTDETREMIGARALALMKPTAYLINTARGGCVNETELARALDAGKIAGAGLDVYAREPRVPSRLLRHRRVVALPHLGSATQATRSKMAELCALAVRAVREGRRPDHVVNPEVYG